MKIVRAVVGAALLLAVCAPLSAQDVTLTSRDGGIEINGNLLGFDGEFYRLDTEYGELTVDGSGVTCDGPGCPDLDDFVAEIRMSGSAGMGELLMPALFEAFAMRNGYKIERREQTETISSYEFVSQQSGKPVAIIDIAATTADEGLADLLSDQSDVWFSTREIRQEERKLALDAGLGDLASSRRSRVLALDAMVPIVAPDNPVRELSTSDLAKVFGGRITNWTELGGPNAKISLHLPALELGLGQSVVDRLLKPANLNASIDIETHALSTSIADAVNSDPFALGITSFGEVANARMVSLNGPCGFSLGANRRNIKSEDYPLTSPLFLYIPARRLPKAGREFLAFLRSPGAQIVIRRAGFVDQQPEEIGIDEQGQRLANAITSAGAEIGLDALQKMIRTLSPLKRLTTSFRFESGSIRLDAQSRSNVQQLARAMELGQYDARRLVFVGFSDGEGPADANQRIAQRRAEAVRRAVERAAETADLSRIQMSIEAYGEAMPMACDDSVWGRQTNRRVEVWVR